MFRWDRRLSIAALLAASVISTGAAADGYEEGDAAFRRKDYAGAFAHWRPLAQGGDARAQAGLGHLYSGGYGLMQDQERALFWYRKAAEQGEAAAQYLLASIYRDGTGVARDLSVAVSYFRKAAEQGFHWAQYNLGLMHFTGEGVSRDVVESYQWLTLAITVPQKDDAGLAQTASFLRDQVGAAMTAEQVAEAKRRAAAWQPKPGQPTR
jgi:TPR repeat protein